MGLAATESGVHASADGHARERWTQVSHLHAGEARRAFVAMAVA